ncbi:hypothetical protein TOK_1631 [Pseudonocardia sp. N23]|nr:hypothetical protein TOK_1631 [Pseudonocardia sp. N23]
MRPRSTRSEYRRFLRDRSGDRVPIGSERLARAFLFEHGVDVVGAWRRRRGRCGDGAGIEVGECAIAQSSPSMASS